MSTVIDSNNVPIFLISERFGHSGGGEAIKAQQYADYLLRDGRDVIVITHARSIFGLGGVFPKDRLRLVPDTAIQKVFWRLKPLRFLLEPYFHLQARKLILREIASQASMIKPILHYISPVSPVALRFPPSGHYVAMGPLTGNIYYPPSFSSRMSREDRIRQRLHNISQRLLGFFFNEKRKSSAILVSGYDRTRASLRLSGCPEEIMIDAIDSGVAEALFERPRIKHEGVNSKFICSGRLVDHKGIDLAIRAIGRARPEVTLDVFGDGIKRPELESLVKELGLEKRVRFRGWVPNHADLIAAFSDYRGYIFPSLAEANGIVMQEAMAAGLPVVALRWGGPGMLADQTSAIFVLPENEEQVVSEIAAALDRLSQDGSFAEAISLSARARAERLFRWRSVVESWQTAYQNYPKS